MKQSQEVAGFAIARTQGAGTELNHQSFTSPFKDEAEDMRDFGPLLRGPKLMMKVLDRYRPQKYVKPQNMSWTLCRPNLGDRARGIARLVCTVEELLRATRAVCV